MKTLSHWHEELIHISLIQLPILNSSFASCTKLILKNCKNRTQTYFYFINEQWELEKRYHHKKYIIVIKTNHALDNEIFSVSRELFNKRFVD